MSGSDPKEDPNRFVVFGEPQILDDEIEEVIACLRSGWIGTGPRVAQFEKDFAAFKHVDHVAAVGSCSAALQLSLLAAGLQPGDEVITSALTFCSTINSIIHAGGVPVPADIDPVTMNLDPRDVEARITPKTRALVPVHFAGRPCDMDTLTAIAARRQLRIIEDCAHAIDADYHGNPVGAIGDFGCFSFYATKNVTTAEGGMVIARREQDVREVRLLALHGLDADAWHRFSAAGYKHYHAVRVGFKHNMTDLQAALGIHQLRRLTLNRPRQQAIWSRYQVMFRDLPVGLPPEPEPGTRHSYHLFTIMIHEGSGIARDDFLEAMTKLGIGAGVHYLSVAEHPVYQERFGWRPEEWPVAHRVGRQTASLPFTPKLTDNDIGRVIGAVYKVLRVG
jgi:dTDP-4-amino-4,6-dideoxygalactose transaminase